MYYFSFLILHHCGVHTPGTGSSSLFPFAEEPQMKTPHFYQVERNYLLILCQEYMAPSRQHHKMGT